MRDLHQQRLIEAAHKRGVEVVDLAQQCGDRLDLVRLRRGDRVCLSIGGTVFETTSVPAQMLADDKAAAKDMLESLGIPTPDGIVFSLSEDARDTIERFLRETGAAVVKPLTGTDGEGVRMDIDSADQVEAHCRAQAARYDRFVLERQVAGRDLRMHVIGGVLVAACERVPCFVTGDGVATVAALVAARRETIRKQNPANRIDIDQQCRELLRDQQIGLDDVPDRHRQIRIKKVANMSQGGLSVDCTDALHLRYREWARAITEALSLRMFSMDCISSDPSIDPLVNASVCIEVNSMPAWLHHTFSTGRRHDMAGMILDELFRSDDAASTGH